MLGRNEGGPGDGGPMASGQGQGADDHPRRGGHTEGERADGTDDILNE